jgi:hypothetical protein
METFSLPCRTNRKANAYQLSKNVNFLDAKKHKALEAQRLVLRNIVSTKV